MKGYKGFDKDFKCRGFQYEVGKEYEIDGNIELCERGFHFCKKMYHVFNYYDGIDCRYAEVEAVGEIKEGNDKCVTNKIRIIREIPRLEVVDMVNSGYENSGNRNSGNRNSGSYNSGNRNSGYYNSGYRNSGNHNLGYRNSGDYNSGYENSGNRNSGNYNSGDYNSGNRNSGVFCTDNRPTIKMFDKESDWTFYNWFSSPARRVMNGCPHSYSDFISESNMTAEEKISHPEHETIGGYIKVYTVTNEDKQKWWDALTEWDKQAIYILPNFDADKFKQCTGIEVNRNEDKRHNL